MHARRALFVVWPLLMAAPAVAQVPAGAEESAPAAVEKPELLEFVEAAYPAEALASRIEATVPLALVLDAAGNVTEASVLAPRGHGFDEAAIAAARRFRFRPARRNGQPVAAKIRYAYAFRLPPAPEPPGPLPPDLPAPLPAAPSAAPAAAPVTDVTVRGESKADRLRHSAEAITVIETKVAKRESSDLGQVMSRSVGLGVRRSGGLGSQTRISLYGLTDDQIRFFENGVPLDFMGFGQGAANVPVNLVDRVEVYRGVVPVRFGADALGGAVNLVTDESDRPTSAMLSYQVGSYGIYRGTLGGRHELPGGFTLGARAFWDHAKNDYPIDVEVADERGRLQPARVRRFHDRYSARGVRLDLGIVNRPWAKKLVLSLFTTDYRKDLQHNSNMTVPYGEVEYGERVYGTTLRYEKTNLFTRGLSLSVLLGYSQRAIDFDDTSAWVYDWFGKRIYERPQRARPPGELTGEAMDWRFQERRQIARLGLGYVVVPDHVLRVVSSAFFTSRTGEDRLWDAESLDPLSGRERSVSVVTGLEYEAHAFDRRLENVAFVKDYLFSPSAEQVIESTNTLEPVESDSRHAFGFGDAVRFRAFDWLWLKASYEDATRLPRPDEMFGNGSTILKNLELLPERSDNANVGFIVESGETPAGSFRGELNGALRAVDDLILLVPAFNPTYAQYINIASAKSTGFDVAAGYTSPREYVSLDGNLTWFDLENTSDTGPQAPFRGDRLPNKPWFTVNGSSRLQLKNVARTNDELWLSWNTQYIGPFFTGWESAGRRDTKSKLPAQLVHGAALGYVLRATLSVTGTLEAQNLTDEIVFDVFGVQKMRRAFFFKGTLEL